MDTIHDFVATPADARTRLDRWLETRMPDWSRARLQVLIRAGHVTLDGAPVLKPHHKVRAHTACRVNVPAPAPVAIVAQDIPFPILFEDGDLIVVDKPAGLVVHPAAGHADGTLVNALLHHCRDLPGIGGEQRPGIVHRLDRDTSGVLVAAKSDRAMAGLVEQFRTRTVHKIYLAIVHGVPRPASGTIETFIGRSSHDRKKMAVMKEHGRAAITHYRLLAVQGDAALLRLHIETGRTHQIRVHLAHRGHPVLGDRTYGRRRTTPDAPRQMLHAAHLAFQHPVTGAALAFHAPIPADMAAVLNRLHLPTPDIHAVLLAPPVP